MPAKEKDKLLLKLIAKDEALIKKLEFQLLEDGESTEERRELLQQEIEQFLETYDKGNYYYSPGYLLMELRSQSAKITAHVKTTRDKYGEVHLNLMLLNKCLLLFGERINKAKPQKSRTIDNYIIKRTLKILGLLKRLHPDMLLDFEEDLIQLGKQMLQQKTMLSIAKFNGLNLEALADGEFTVRSM